MISAIIAAYNEEETIGEIIRKTKPFVDEVIVVDDASTDRTSLISERNGARVIRNNRNLGQLKSLKKGFLEACGDIIVTLDADGEHNSEDIPRLVKPILENRADLVLGKREIIPRPSERWIDRLVSLKTQKFYDSGTGFRSLTKKLALKLKLNARCVCGVLVLEALSLGARIEEVFVSTNFIDKPRKIAWQHIPQFFIVFKEMFS